MLFTCYCNTCSFETMDFVDTNAYDATHSWKKPRSGALVVSSNNRILLVQNYGQKWGVPKGKLAGNETRVQCAVRETREETSIDISRFVRSHVCHVDKKTNTAMYIVKLDSEPEIVPVTYDITGYGWFDVGCIMKNQRCVNMPSMSVIQTYK